MIPVSSLANSINQAIVTGDSNDLQLNQLAQSSIFLESNTVFSVANSSFLPLPSKFQGALVYAVSENRYYFSDGIEWRLDYSSVPAQPTTTLYTWGRNSYGQLGDGTTTQKSSPITVIGGITNWRRISTGALHKLGITTSGLMYGWGYNGFGRLGDNTTSNRSSPVTVVGGITNWSQVSAGTSHSVGLTSTGLVYAWGLGSSGQLGQGSTANSSSPVSIVGGITTWSSLSAGLYHNLAITTAGIAYAWGSNTNGRLGDNTSVVKFSPVTVVGGITTWSQVSAGDRHSLGLTSAGVLYAWGYNNRGQLGDNTTSSKNSPVAVIGNITNWSQITGGNQFSIGLTANSIVYAWGANGYGQLGDNTTSSRSSPVTIVGGITNWQQISSTGSTSSTLGSQSIGLTTNGILYGWGRNSYGMLGTNSTAATSSPMSVVGGITTWAAISDRGSGMALSTRTTLDAKGFL